MRCVISCSKDFHCKLLFNPHVSLGCADKSKLWFVFRMCGASRHAYKSVFFFFFIVKVSTCCRKGHNEVYQWQNTSIALIPVSARALILH